MEEKVKMRKQLGLLEGVAIILGLIFGTGIFITPQDVMEKTGSPFGSLVVWGVCGFLVTLGALSYAELGTTLAQSGGDYHYIHEAYGPIPAFLYLWDAVIVFVPSTNAIMARTFAKNLLDPLTCGELNILAEKLVAAAGICLLTFINAYNIKFTTRIQNVFMFTKIAALGSIIIGGLVWVCQGIYWSLHAYMFKKRYFVDIMPVEMLLCCVGLFYYICNTGNIKHLDNGWANTKLDASTWAAAFYSGYFTYAGWNYLNFMTEELKNPFKNLPRAIYISLPLVTVIYLLANFSYIVVLGPTGVLKTNAIAVDFANTALVSIKWAMPILVVIAVFGGLSVHIMASARMCFAGARNHHMPELLAHINMKCMSPLPSLVFLMLMSLVMLIPNNLSDLVLYCTFVETFFNTLSCSAVIYLRYKKPELPRPIKINLLVPSTFILCSVVMALFSVYSKPAAVLTGVGMTLAGLPVYYLFVVYQPDFMVKYTTKFTHVCQKVFFSAVEEKED